MARTRIHDDIFGELTWDASYDRWSGEFDLKPGHGVSIDIALEGRGRKLPTLEICHRTFARIRDKEAVYRQHAATQLFEQGDILYRTIREDVTEETLATTIRLQAITLHLDGRAQLWYSDPYHPTEDQAVMVALDEYGAVTVVDIVG